MQHLPRPWMLAALADVPVTLLARPRAQDADPIGMSMPRPGRKCGDGG